MAAPTTVQCLSENSEHYNVAIKLYRRLSGRNERMIGWINTKLPSLVDSFADTLGKDWPGPLNVMSVGAGDGITDHTILQQLRARMLRSKIQIVILEPDSHTMQQYQDLASRESATLQGIDFHWRLQTFQEYHSTSAEDEQFHVIICCNSIYYCGILEESVKFLYRKLEPKGFLLITVAAETGFGKLWEYLHRTLGRKNYYATAIDVEDACRKQNIPITEIQIIPKSCNISICFDPPEELTQDGSILLDFLTHTVNFARSAPAEYRDDLLRFLASPACSDKDPDGEVILDVSNAAIIVTKK